MLVTVVIMSAVAFTIRHEAPTLALILMYFAGGLGRSLVGRE